MVSVMISPDVAPGVYDALAACLTPAVEAAESGVKAMHALEARERAENYEQAAAILAAIQRQLQRQGTQP